MPSTAFLLIEPVWNRNPSGIQFRRVAQHPFNRTSMESKLLSKTPVGRFSEAFNRTSMESKPAFLPTYSLIHNSFNRTSMESKHGGTTGQSLKKLTFNRTSMESKLRCNTPCI